MVPAIKGTGKPVKGTVTETAPKPADKPADKPKTMGDLPDETTAPPRGTGGDAAAAAREAEVTARVQKLTKEVEELGAGEILLTSMDRDGTQVGYDIDLMSKISSTVNIPVIASGGVGNLDHLVDGIKLGKANAVLAASIFHYGKYSVKEAKEYLNSKGIPVRI